MLSSKTIAVMGVVLILAVGASVANADMTSSGTWVLNQSNTFADGVYDYGQVTIDANATTGVVQFTVEAFNVQPLYGSLNNFGIDSFGFNYENVTSSLGDWDWQALPTDWVYDAVANQDGFGSFDIRTAGPGSNRQVELSFEFKLPNASEAIASNFAVLAGGNPDQGNVLFAAHVAGFSANGATSHFIGGPGGSTAVPAPGAALLGMIGLATIAWLKRYFA